MRPNSPALNQPTQDDPTNLPYGYFPLFSTATSAARLVGYCASCSEHSDAMWLSTRISFSGDSGGMGRLQQECEGRTRRCMVEPR